MKKTRISKPHVLLAAALALCSLAPALAAQPSIPTESSTPVIPPGKAGTEGRGLAPKPSATAIDTTVADIMRNPAGYAGRSVRVTSTVEEIYTPWSIRLDEQQLLAGGIDNDILVLGAEPLVTMGFKSDWLNKKISVTGTVRILEGTDFRQEYGRGVDDELFRRFASRPAIVASSMKRLD